MKVLVTGGCGFIGSHVCEFYKNRGDSVIAYDNMTKYELCRTGYMVDGIRKYNLDFLKKLGVIIDSHYVPLVTASPGLLSEFEKQ